MEDEGDGGSDPASGRASPELDRSVARCRRVADHLRDTHAQKLAAEVLILGAAARREEDQARRDVLLARAKMIQGCVGTILQTADRLAGLVE